MSSRTSSVIPGFGLTLGYTLVYLSLLVLIPLGALFLKTTELTWDQFVAIISAPRVLAALKLSFGTAFVAALLNGVIGTLLAWVLVRYTFPGRKVIEAMIDLPFALPTAVAGIALGLVLAVVGIVLLGVDGMIGSTHPAAWSANGPRRWASRSPTARWALPWR